ncbi:MAG: hypothetical protein RQ741_13155 [Wenzhouxiangellaceae bacterium]|nr:hypothetical protein [Wenzhouxiangellaceae bacterium]
MKTIIAFLLAFSLPGLAQNDSELLQYKVETAVWCSGQLRGEPELVLTPGQPGQFEIDSPESRWRLSVEIEPPSAGEGAGPDALWFKVEIEQMIDGRWQFLTDTMLGVPPGQPGRITVLEQGDAESNPNQAPLYVELRAHRIDSE